MYRLRLTLHFLTLDVITHSERLYNWIGAHYKSFDQSKRFVDKAQSYTIQIEDIESPQVLAMGEPGGTRVKFCLLDETCYYKNGVFASSNRGSFIHQCQVDTVARTAKVNVGGDLLRSEEDFIYNVMRDLLKSLVLRVNGLLTLHGAVVTRGGTSIFLAGEKGMGKSTISLKLMQQGYSMISDDSPLFTSIDGSTYALSSLDELSVTENTLRLFPELKPFVTRQREISGKYFISRTLLGENKLSYGPSAITHFIDLKRGHHRQAALIAQSKDVVTAQLFREDLTLFNLEHPIPDFFSKVNRFQFDTLGQLIDGAHTYILEYSDEHLDQLPGLIEAVTEEAVCR